MVQDIFFDLLKVAIGNLKQLSCNPNDEEWIGVYDLCKKHTLLGIGYAGIQTLPKEQWPPKALVLKWFANAAKIVNKNSQMNILCKQICEKIEKDGFKIMVIKGQGNIPNYSAMNSESIGDFESLGMLRTPGDIDAWLIPIDSKEDYRGNVQTRRNRKEIIVNYSIAEAKKTNESDDLTIRYHHVDMPVSNGCEIEAHFMPMYFNNPFLDKRLQRFFEKYGNVVVEKVDSTIAIPLPSVSFNVIYQLTHIYKHVFEEGVGLRQLLDYYMVINRWHRDCMTSQSENVLTKEKIDYYLNYLGLRRLAGAVMYVLQEVFALPDEMLLCQPEPVAGASLLDYILVSGNFGKYDPKKLRLVNESSLHKFFRKTNHNLSLVRFYPNEAICEPFFRVYHWMWRRFEWWRWER